MLITYPIKLNCFPQFAILCAATLLLTLSGSAQPFLTPDNGDLLAGFRKTGVYKANYEAVAKIGNITNLEAMAPGSQIVISSYTPAQLTDAFTDYNHLQWSVFGSFKVFGTWSGFPNYTVWFTIPRTNSGSQSPPPDRMISSAQTTLKQWILGVGTGAAYISSSGPSNVDNTATFVREPSGDIQHALSVYIADPNDATIGDFNATLPYTVENTTPASFSAALRSDLYQMCPSGTTDPITHLTSGSAYYVGYFQFNPDGTMSFTRAAAAGPPPPLIVSITRSNGTSRIYFTTTNGPTYQLYYTNSTGLGAPISNWPSLPGTLVGDGKTNSLSDATTTDSRFYRVGLH
jgi:hypothetical protein